jgi:hypothetical protein
MSAAGRKRAGPTDRFVPRALDMGTIELFGRNDWNHDFPRVCCRETKGLFFIDCNGNDIDRSIGSPCTALYYGKVKMKD